METRLIDANALMKRICGHECGMYPEDCDGMESETVPCNFHTYVSEAPTVDAVPVKRGEWIVPPVDSDNRVYCSVCGWRPYGDLFTNFCAGCGAKMSD